MKAIQIGNTYRIYDNSMKTYDQLPAQNYLVNFNMNDGFYLTLYSDINVNEKVYGVHKSKVEKVLRSFSSFERNLGVILSGDKGIGKSLCSKLLAKIAVEEYNLPVIIVNTYYRGIAEYLNQINQEVLVLFDEFDKTFKDDESSSQAEMLSLFDGISQGKKLFVVTCNSLRRLNDFLVNRPGRFHYHFRFEYPNSDEIREYMVDKLPANKYGEIDKVISFSRKVNLNYDCLRAIAFELLNEDTFEDAIKDLNILNLNNETYIINVSLTNGEKFTIPKTLDLFSGDREVCIELTDRRSGEDVYDMYFTPIDNHYNATLDKCVIDPDNVRLEFQKYITCSSDKDVKEVYNRYKDAKIELFTLEKQAINRFNYAV